MLNSKYILFISMIITLLIVFLFIVSQVPEKVSGNFDNNLTINSTEQNPSLQNLSYNITNKNTSDEKNFSPNLIESDFSIDQITWDRYPILNKEYIDENRVAGPNNVIDHKFIIISIKVNTKDPENTNELFREMAGIVMEMRQLVGPDSSPEVWCKVDGIESYHVEMVPFDDRIYASDHYHPQAYKNEIYLLPGDDIYDYHSYTIVNNSVIEP